MIQKKDDNPNPVIRRIAVKVICVFKTPALIGSGMEDNTDNDIIRYSSEDPFQPGNPYLPGSTIAGKLKSICPEADALFGINDNASPLWVFDAELPDNVIELDGVALDPKNKVAYDKKKYDFEAIDAGSPFTLRLLLTIRKAEIGKDYETLLCKLLGALEHGEVSFGAKTNRGFGMVEHISACQQCFEFTNVNKTDLEKWLEFDWKNSAGWEKASAIEFESPDSKLVATLKLDGSIMIRDTRNIYEDMQSDAKAPDYKHISLGSRPVILGTSWAGAFRSGLYRLLKRNFPDKAESYLNEIFGYVLDENDDESGDENDDSTSAAAQASLIVFGASFLEATDKKTEGYRSITRVKIDRFTGGAADGALFTEMPWYGGKTTLEIRFPKERADIRELLLLGLDCINKGLIQIGGESSIGRGFFTVTNVKIDGTDVEISDPKPRLVEKVGGIA